MSKKKVASKKATAAEVMANEVLGTAKESPQDWSMVVPPEAAGWIPPEDRTDESKKIHKQYLDDVPTVSEAFTSPGYVKDRPRAWQLVAEAIKKNWIPKEFLRNGQLKNIAQIIGSCVGFGAGNMLFWASLIDAICRKQKDRIIVPFVPYHYGRGRLHSGIRGPGSGSFGSGQAKALQLDGFLAFDQEGVPKPTFGDAIYWTQDIEYSWSDGARIEQKWIDLARKHLNPTVARVTNTDEAAQLADNLYSFTIASSYGGKMQCPIVKGVLLNSHVGTWNHQMWSPDYIIHPELGRLWWIGNNWRYPHGKDPGGPWDGNTGAPEGGFYIVDKDMQWILSKQDSFAFADPQGFEDRSRAFDWVMV